MKIARNWKEFERLVSDLFSLKGFSCTNDTREAGRQNDIILISNEEYVGRILVECKFHDPTTMHTVGVTEVDAFAAKALRLRQSGDINAAYLVTNSDFSANAKGAFYGRPEGKFLFLRTYSQLLYQLINFKPYYRRYIEQFEAEGLHLRYEPLNMTIAEEMAVVSIESNIRAFITSDDKRILHLLVGDFGTGKTTTCNYLFYTFAKEAVRDDYVGRLPCLLPLRRYNHSGSAQAFILDYLASGVGVRGVSFDPFDAMNKAGLLTIILDGFDEMAKRVTRQVRDECFRAIGELCHLRSKVVLSGRPTFFPDSSQMLGTVNLACGSKLVPRSRKPKSNEQFVMVGTIQPLDEAQILSFLEKHSKFHDKAFFHQGGRDFCAKLEQMYNLKELATRPILLEMICEKSEEINKGTVHNVVELYDLYTSEWLEVDAQKGGFRTLVTPEERLHFSMRLAWKMATDGVSAVHFSDLPDIVGEHFGLDESEDIDYYASDVRTCTFLKRSDSGHYSFAHQSFHEYFCARYVASANGKDKIRIQLNASTMDTLGELFEALPNSFHFLDQVFRCPLATDFWQPVSAGEAELFCLLEQFLPTIDDSWSTVDALADGSIPIEDVKHIIDGARSIVSALKRANRILAKDRLKSGWKAGVVENMHRWSQVFGQR